MGALPRPDLPTGPLRELNDALHDLHHRAGWPSLRTMARDAGCSHTTVSAVFSSPRLPSWGVLELVVESLDGDVPAFHRHWLSASTATGTEGEPPPPPTLAGRVDELTLVGRHLETGTGLLLVTGEAGIGKTALVTTAASTATTSGRCFVATGACLPLSASVPLLPVADALQACWRHDDGAWIRAAADSHPHLAPTLAVLLPGLATIDPHRPDDPWALHRLFTAVATTLDTLVTHRRLALLLDDLHWADSTTLDLLEHLVSRSTTVPITATWRLDDDTTSPDHRAWLARLRRDRRVRVLDLDHLTPDETTAQLTLLLGRAPDPTTAAEIHRRTLGHPLFTEQLATRPDPAGDLPVVLADLLDHRLNVLDGAPWDLAVALAVADRPVGDDDLASATGLDHREVALALRHLRRRHLVTTGSATPALRHPLLAEAVRRRLTATERRLVHGALARALAGAPDPQAGEVAEHWRAAGDDGQELVWRIRAAEAAGARYAWLAEGDHWDRALDLWPEAVDQMGSPPVRRCEAYVRAMDALQALDLGRATALAERALLLTPDLPPGDAAAIWARAGDYLDGTGQSERGLALVERAVAVHETLPPSDAHVRALTRLAGVLRGLGRYGDARAAVIRAAEVAGHLDDPGLERAALVDVAWHDAQAGDLTGALDLAARAWEIAVDRPRPQDEINPSADYTDILLVAAGPVDLIERVAERGLTCARDLGIETYAVSIIRSNLAQGFLRAGLVGRAGEVVDPVTTGAPELDQWAVHLERSAVDLRRGLLGEAASRHERVAGYALSSIAHRTEVAAYGAEIDLWSGAPGSALERLLPSLTSAARGEAAQDLGPALVLAARAVADLPATERGAEGRRLDALRAACAADPFSSRGAMAARNALPATWRAERARAAGTAAVAAWVEAAAAWDGLGRPHDAAYARWRGAQVALREGQATAATRLLRRATREAREHVPLSAAIDRTAAYAQGP